MWMALNDPCRVTEYVSWKKRMMMISKNINKNLLYPIILILRPQFEEGPASKEIILL